LLSEPFQNKIAGAMRITVFLLLCSVAFAKEKPTVTITVEDSHVRKQSVPVYLPGRNRELDTNCTTSDGQTNCATTNATRNVLHIDLHAIMPDGSRALLWCEVNLRYCTDLEPGKYQAELDRGTAWVYVTTFTESPKYANNGTLLPRKTRVERVKYKILVASSPP